MQFMMRSLIHGLYQQIKVMDFKGKKVKADYETIRNRERYSDSGHVLGVNDEAFEEVIFAEPAEAPLHTIPKDELFKVLDEKYISSGLALASTFPDLTYDEHSDEVFREYLDGRIRSLVNDPEKAAVLTPKSGRFYDRRPVMDTHYYETFNKENVDLVDVNKKSILLKHNMMQKKLGFSIT